MKLNKFFILCLTAGLIFSCNKDDNPPEVVPPRDRGEVALENDQEILDYLSTHFYNYEDFQSPSEEFNYEIVFDTIAGENADKTPIIDSDDLMTKTVNNEGVDQKLYILKIREGAGKQPTFADSAYVAYNGEFLNNELFNNNIKTPIWFDLPGYYYINQGSIQSRGSSIVGFREGITEFKAASGFKVNPDNTIQWNNDYGVGALFMPSGLAYFNSPPGGSGIAQYEPLIFTFKLYRANEADHDRDGIPSYMEDLDGDGDLYNDDTDGNNLPNHSDADDDGDGTPTKDEIVVNEDGTVTFTDSNSDGTPDYLDPDVFK